VRVSRPAHGKPRNHGWSSAMHGHGTPQQHRSRGIRSARGRGRPATSGTRPVGEASDGMIGPHSLTHTHTSTPTPRPTPTPTHQHPSAPTPSRHCRLTHITRSDNIHMSRCIGMRNARRWSYLCVTHRVTSRHDTRTHSVVSLSFESERTLLRLVLRFLLHHHPRIAAQRRLNLQEREKGRAARRSVSQSVGRSAGIIKHQMQSVRWTGQVRWTCLSVSQSQSVRWRVVWSLTDNELGGIEVR